MKALEKDRGRRYGTASAFANDIELYLADEPVQAGPPGSAYRLRKFARKHRRSIATAAFLLLILVAGVVVSTWQAIRARSEQRRANQAALQATREADEARKQKEIAKSARAESERLAAREQKSRVQAEHNLYYARITAAQNALEAGDRQAARRILDQCLADQRRWEWYYLVTQTRPTSKVMRDVDFPGAASFAPDGSRLAAWIGSTGAFSVWDVATGQRLCTRWPKPNDNPYFKSCAPIWSPDGEVLAWCDGQTIELVKSSSGETVHRWPALHSVFRMVWHPTKNRLATLGIDGKFRIWNLDTQSMIQEIEMPVSASHGQYLQWSHDGKMFAVGGKSSLGVFDCANWKKIASLEAGFWAPFWGWAPHSNRLLFSAAVKPNEEHPIISVWERGKDPVPVAAFYKEAIHIAWSPDGTELAWIHQHNGTVHIHDSVTGEERKVFEPGYESTGRWVAWNGDGTRLASTGAEGSVKVWNRDSTTTKPESVLLGHERQIRWVAWNPNGEASLASFSTDKSLRFWKLDNQADASQVIRLPDPVASLSWGPDGKRVACAAEQIARLSSAVQIWDSETGKPLGDAFSPGGWSIDWSRQNRLLCLQPDRWTVRIVDPDAQVDITLGDRPETLPQEVVKGSGVRWSPDGRWLAMATYDGVFVWDLARRHPIHLKNTENPNSGWAVSLAWRPDGSRLAVIYRGDPVHEVVIYDFDIRAEELHVRWRQRRTAAGLGHPSELAWSPDGKLVAMGDPDQSIRLWRADDGQLVSVHRGHTGEVNCIDWSPDGARFASAGEDGTVRIWSPQSGQSVLVLRGHTRAVSAVQWNQDGMRLASAGLDSTIRIWDAREGYLDARSEQALAALNDRLASQPDDQKTLKIRAEILMRSDQWKKAGGELDRWLRLPDATGQRKKWYSTGWWVSGPYQETHLKAPPEMLEQNALDAAFQRDGVKSTTQLINWRYVKDSDHHYLNLRQEFDADGISAYALSRIYSSREQEVRLSVRADDAVRIWINGKPAHSDEEGRVRTIGDVPSEFLGKLRPGWNVLLAKVVNAPDTDRFELSVKVTDSRRISEP